MPPLGALGSRIAILGPSNSGKSTLAVSIAQKAGIAAVHIDQLRHIPYTNWQERSDEEFAQLHNAAIAAESWVMEGNYSKLLPQRLERATGLILLNSNLWLRYFRYVKRSLKNTQSRAGHLAGGQDRLSWWMTSWIFKTRDNVWIYEDILAKTGKPMVFCRTANELDQLYGDWNLPIPGSEGLRGACS